MSITMKMKGKLLALALVSAMPFCLLLGAALLGLRAGADRLASLYDNEFQRFEKLALIDGHLTRADINILRMLAIADTEMMGELKRQNVQRFESAQKSIDELDRAMGRDMEGLRESYASMREGMLAQMEALEQGDRERATEVNRTRVKPHADATFSALASLAGKQSAEAKAAVARQIADARSTLLMTIALALVALCSSVAFALGRAKGIVVRLEEAADDTRKIAQPPVPMSPETATSSQLLKVASPHGHYDFFDL